MTREQDILEATRDWFVKAVADIRCATVDIQARPPLAEDALFHRQQAVEKCLKGFLVYHGREFPRTHHLSHLGGLCESIDASLAGIVDEVAPLTAFATMFRYPNVEPCPEVEEAREGVALAKRMLAEMRELLPTSALPQIDNLQE